MIDFHRKAVSLLEILRSFADAYAKAGYVSGVITQRCQSDAESLKDPVLLGMLQGQLRNLKEHCGDLPLSERHIDRILTALACLEVIQDKPGVMAMRLKELQTRLEDESWKLDCFSSSLWQDESISITR